MAKKKIGAIITLDGGTTFRKEVTTCNKSLTAMKSELNLVKAETAGNANTLETLQKKHTVLNDILQESTNKQNKVQEGLSHARNEYERVGKELKAYEDQLRVAEENLKKLETATNSSSESIKKQEEEVERLRDSVEKGSEVQRKAKDRVSEWEKSLNNAKAQVIRANRELAENRAYLKEAEESWNKQAQSIDKYGEKVDKTIDKLTEFGTVFKATMRKNAIDAGQGALESLIQTGMQGAMDIQDAQAQLQASTGATAEATREYAKEMKDLYTSGYADSMEEVANTMALVKQYTSETNPEKIRALAENAITLRDVFDMDISETLRGADALIDEMGVDGDRAFNLIAKGAQNGLNKSGELTDNLAEYAPLWSQAGFSAEEMFAILENGLNSGAYNLDKVNDYVKEFGISLADGRIADNINSFSSNTRDLFVGWQNGEVTTKQVFQSVINDLATMENQQQALTIASNTWSSLGEDNAMKVLTSLNKVNNSYMNVQGTMDSIKNTKYDTLSNQIMILGRKFQNDIAVPIIEKALPAAEKGIDFVSNNIEVCTIAATALSGAFTTAFVVNKVEGFQKAISYAAEGVKKLSGVTKIFSVFKAKDTAVTVAQTAATTANTEATAGNAVATTANVVSINEETGATVANTAATVAETEATIAQEAATTGAAGAQTILNAAMEASPVGVFMLGLTAVVGVLAMVSGQMEDTITKTEELAEETEKSIDQVEDASKKLEKATSGWGDSIKDLNANEGVADDLVSELYSLESQTNGTKEELARMNAIVDKLNIMFPDLSLTIDKNTGALNKNENQTKSAIKTALSYSKAQAAQKEMSEIAEELVNADMAKYQAKKQLDEIDNQLLELEKERQRIEKEGQKVDENGISARVEYNGKMLDSYDALLQINSEEQRLRELQEEQGQSVEELTEQYEKANEEYKNAYEYLEKVTNGTKESNNAIKDNTEANKENAEAVEDRKEKSTVSIEMAGQETEAYRNLSAAQQNMAVEVTNAVIDMQEGVTGVLESQMDMFEKFDEGTKISKDKLLENMKSQVDGVTEWEKNLSELADKGINQGILQKLIDMGPEGASYVKAFNDMSAEELKKADKLWDKSVDIKGMTNKWGQELLESGAENIAGGMENLDGLLEKSGANTVTGLVNGMKAAQVAAQAAGSDLGIKTVESINSGLGCASPSKKTKLSGTNTVAGLNIGMKSGIPEVKEVSKNVADAATGEMASKLTISTFQTYGRNITTGLKKGIEGGKKEVITAIEKMCDDVIEKAKDKLEIHSPSHVFREMANNTMDSYVLGIQERIKTVRETVGNAVDFRGIPSKMSQSRESSLSNIDYEMLKEAWKEAARQTEFAVYLNDRNVARGLSKMGVKFHA